MSRSRPIALVLILILAACPYLLTETYAGDYAVIVNPRNPVQTISSAQLRKLVLGEEKFWPGRIPVELILQDERSVERTFVLGKLLNMSQGEYREHWLTLIFRGATVSEPVAVPSNGLASGLVQVQVGALCIMRADNVPKGATVRVIRVDGKLPGETGYPLH